MRFNSRFWIAVIAISLLVIGIKSYKAKQVMPHTFERSYVPNRFSTPLPESTNDSIKNYNNIVLAGGLMAEYRTLAADSAGSIMDFDFYDLQERTETVAKNVRMDNTPDFFTKDALFFTAGYELYRLEISSRKKYRIFMDSLKVLKAFPLSQEGSELLVLGEQRQKNGAFLTGFFKFDGTRNTVKLVLPLESNAKPHFCENFLVYAGSFSRSERHITFSCSKQSNIFLFKNDGNFETTVKTSENVPKAEIVEINGIYGYKRGKTFSTNIGAFIKEDTLFSFSLRESSPNGMTLDSYSITGSYLGSMSIAYKGKTNKNLYYVSQAANKIFLHLDDEIAFMEL